MAALLPVLGLEAAHADVTQLSPDGTLHRVDIFSDGETTAIRHTLQEPSGLVHTIYVPGTQDEAVESDPTIEIDPLTGQPVLVWIRLDDSSTALAISRFDGATWTEPVVVTAGGESKSRPLLRIGGGLIHVAYRQGILSPPTSILVSIDRSTFSTVYGPTALTTDEASPIPVEGAPAEEATVPPSGDSFFTMDGPPLLPEEPPRIIVYGARDEPVPVNFLQGFLLPSDVIEVESSGVDVLSGHLTVWYVSADFFYYVFREPAAWSDTRVIRLNPLTVSDARVLVRQALAREPTPSQLTQ